MGLLKILRGYPFVFVLFYALAYMVMGVYGTFIPVYFMGLGYNQTAIGTLLALGPFVALLAQPIWGTVSDRAKSKTTVLRIMLAGTAGVTLLFRVNNSFVYLCIIVALFVAFYNPVYAISDAITLEHLREQGRKFGPIRMAGTIGFAITAAVSGIIAKQDINLIFVLLFIVAVATLAATIRIPNVKGHQFGASRVSPRVLLKNKELLTLLVMGFILNTSLGFNGSFYGIFLKQMGADNSLVGWASCITAFSEIPFLLCAHKVLHRFGPKRVMLFSLAMSGLRWLLLYNTHDVNTVLWIGTLHGVNFIVCHYSLATYISTNVPKELRATGQTLNGMVNLGLARILGSLGGGFLSDAVGIRSLYLWNGVLAVVVTVVFLGWFAKESTIQTTVGNTVD